MKLVGSLIGERRGRLGLLAVLVIALTAVCSVSASDAATARAKGLDVSNWNGAINWTKVANAGYRFAFGKATEGTGYTDTTYTTNRNGSEAAGLVFGAYHFARPSGTSLAAATMSAITQANHFLAIASPQPGELPPVLDLEKTGNLPKQRLLAWTLAWLGQIDARTGVEPFVYTSPLFWKGNLGDSTAAAATGTGLWIAHWTASSQPQVPAQNWDGDGWKFWQWTNCVSVPGIKHCSDGDRMNGTKLASVAIAPYPSGVPVLSTPRPANFLPPCLARGWAASRSRSPTSGDVATPQAPTALRSPARPASRTGRRAPTWGTHSGSSSRPPPRRAPRTPRRIRRSQ